MIKRRQNIGPYLVIVNDNDLSKLEGESEAYHDLYRSEKFLNTNLETENAELRERVGELEEAIEYIKDQNDFYGRIVHKLPTFDKFLVYEKIEMDEVFLSKLKNEGSYTSTKSSPLDVEKGEEG